MAGITEEIDNMEETDSERRSQWDFTLPLSIDHWRDVVTKDRGPEVQPGWTVIPVNMFIKKPDPKRMAWFSQSRLEYSIRREVEACEMLRQKPHPNIASYYGCTVANNRVKGLCFERYDTDLHTKANPKCFSKRSFTKTDRPYVTEEVRRAMDGLKSAVAHMHSLGLVHNDIKPTNIMFKGGEMILIDFGSCRRIGEDLRESYCGRTDAWYDDTVTTALPKNDWDAVKELETWLFGDAEDYLFVNPWDRYCRYA